MPMTFTQQGNVLTSIDGRFQVEKMFDHRGKLYHAWQVRGERADFEGCWQYLGQYQSADEAKKACEVAGEKNEH